MLALLLMLFDYHNVPFHRFRNQADFLISPIENTVTKPFKWIGHLSADLATRQHLVSENQHLQAKQMMLQGEVQHLLAMQHENKQLRALLSSAQKTQHKVREAQVIGISPDPLVLSWELGQGRQAGVFVNQPVLDAYGVLGQITQVGRSSSHVMLLTNRRSAIPVEDARNQMRAIASGDGPSGTLSLHHVAQTTDIRVGDLLVTSGLGQRYPYGYPVAKVTKVVHKPGNPFADIRLLPMAHLNQSRLVLLVWPTMVEKKSSAPSPSASSSTVPKTSKPAGGSS